MRPLQKALLFYILQLCYFLFCRFPYWYCGIFISRFWKLKFGHFLFGAKRRRFKIFMRGTPVHFKDKFCKMWRKISSKWLYFHWTMCMKIIFQFFYHYTNNVCISAVGGQRRPSLERQTTLYDDQYYGDTSGADVYGDNRYEPFVQNLNVHMCTFYLLQTLNTLFTWIYIAVSNKKWTMLLNRLS